MPPLPYAGKKNGFSRLERCSDKLRSWDVGKSDRIMVRELLMHFPSMWDVLPEHWGCREHQGSAKLGKVEACAWDRQRGGWMEDRESRNESQRWCPSGSAS